MTMKKNLILTTKKKIKDQKNKNNKLTMKYEIKEISATKKKVEIEVSAEEFINYYGQALKEISVDAEVPGFRKGKVPENVIEGKVSSDGIVSEAAEIAIRENWMKFLSESKEEAISQPQVEVTKIAKDNPLVFTAEYEILPEIKLPELKTIEITKKEVTVEEKEVEETLKWIQQSRAKYLEKENGAEKEDLVEFAFSCISIENDPEKKDRIVLGKGHYIEGLEEALLGMKKGEEKEFETTDPRKKEDKIKIKVKIDSIKKIELPEINEDLVKELGSFETIDDLKKDIKEGIKKDKEAAEIQKNREEAIKKMIEKTKFDVPEILVQRELDYMMRTIKERVTSELNITFEEYLKQSKKTEKDVLDEIKKTAEEKVKGFLVLHQLIKDNKIEVEEKEVNEKIEEMLNQYGDKEEMRKKVDMEQAKLYVEDELKREKAFKLLGC